MPVDVFPEFAPPRVEIQTPCLGLSSTEVEQLVTVPLEEVFNGTPGLAVMRSKSVEQLSSIVLIFDAGTDVMQARQEVAERLAIATPTLPNLGRPAVYAATPVVDRPTMKIGISSKEHVRDRSVDDHLLEDPGALAGRTAAWPMWRSGASGSKCRRCTSIRNGWPSTALR